MEGKEAKADRLLKIYSQLAGGAVLGKRELAQRFHISERTVLWDIDALRCFLEEQGLRQEEGSWVIEAEVFGKGIEMWLRSQGSYVTDIKF